jgi:glycerophosphoryl diester phosphodiesterase
LIIVWILLGVLLIYYGAYLLLRGPRSERPLLIAHRGGPKYAPENTLAAFRNAIQAGVDMLECDVQRTRDGGLVVIHDETVDRTTNGKGRVEDLTLAEIQALDAGGGERVPTFQEYAALAGEFGVAILPELKSPRLYPGIEAETVQAINLLKYASMTRLQSFDLAALQAVQAAAPDQVIWRLYGLGQFNLSRPEPAQVEAVCPAAEMVLLYPWMIRQAHRQGKKVVAWYLFLENNLINRLLLAFGVDGLIVDDPVAARRVMRR